MQLDFVNLSMVRDGIYRVKTALRARSWVIALVIIRLALSDASLIWMDRSSNEPNKVAPMVINCCKSILRAFWISRMKASLYCLMVRFKQRIFYQFLKMKFSWSVKLCTTWWCTYLISVLLFILLFVQAQYFTFQAVSIAN